MTNEIDRTWAFTCVEEGGDLSLDSEDNGNWTLIGGQRTLLGSKYGVSADDLVRMVAPRIPTKADMANLTQAAAEANFNVHYVSALRMNDPRVPPGFLCMVTDFGYNAGVMETGRTLQTALGMTGEDVDGWIGDDTLTVLQAAAASRADFGPALEMCSLAAVEEVQKAVGVVADGRPGPKTHAAVAASKASMAVAMLALIATDQVTAYRSFAQFPRYGNDWTARSWRRLALSLKIALEA